MRLWVTKSKEYKEYLAQDVIVVFMNIALWQPLMKSLTAADGAD